MGIVIFIAGAMFGAGFGVLAGALCAVSKHADETYEEQLEKEGRKPDGHDDEIH